MLAFGAGSTSVCAQGFPGVRRSRVMLLATDAQLVTRIPTVAVGKSLTVKVTVFVSFTARPPLAHRTVEPLSMQFGGSDVTVTRALSGSLTSTFEARFGPWL